MWKLTLFVLPPLCLAQTAKVDGRVINLAGAPLNKATVALVGNTRTPAAPLPPAYAAVTDSEGRFQFDTVEPGAYRIFADRAGYLPYVFTEPNGRVVADLESGARRSLEVKLTPQSFLSGRVLDEDGDPFPNARITILRAARANGAQQLRTVATVIAGPDGGFVSNGLEAGRYHIVASGPPTLTQSNQREVGPAPARYVPTYFPSAIEVAAATAIDVPVGGESRYNDIRMRRARTFHILGRVVDSSGNAPPNVSVRSFDPNVVNVLDQEPPRIFAADGMFQINRVLPGTYAIAAQSGALRARQFVTVTDRDIEDLRITVASGFEIPVNVIVEDSDSALRERILSGAYSRYTLTATDRLNENAMISRKPDGTWSFTDIGPGTYRMGIGAPEGAYIKSIRYGDRDITSKSLDAATAAPLTVVFSPHAAEVTGTVRNKDGDALPGVQVTLWVPGSVPTGDIDPARTISTDAKGTFHFANLRPGEYRLAAWEKIESGLSSAPDFRARFENRATKLSIEEDARETVQPVLIATQAIEEVAAQLR